MITTFAKLVFLSDSEALSEGEGSELRLFRSIDTRADVQKPSGNMVECGRRIQSAESATPNEM